MAFSRQEFMPFIFVFLMRCFFVGEQFDNIFMNTIYVGRVSCYRASFYPGILIPLFQKKALLFFDKLQILQDLLKWTEFPSVLHSVQSYYGIDLGF